MAARSAAALSADVSGTREACFSSADLSAGEPDAAAQSTREDQLSVTCRAAPRRAVAGLSLSSCNRKRSARCRMTGARLVPRARAVAAGCLFGGHAAPTGDAHTCVSEGSTRVAGCVDWWRHRSDMVGMRVHTGV